jgi:hypothetical protein
MKQNRNKRIKKILGYFIVGLLLVSNFYICLLLRSKNNELDKINKTFKDRYYIETIENFTNLSEYKFQLNNDLNNIFRNGEELKLIYRCFNDDCLSCIIDDLETIKGNKKIDLSKLLILPEMSIDRNEMLKKNSLFEKYNHLFLADSLLRLDHTRIYHHRFFALLDSKGTLSMVFVPHKELPEVTNKYLNFIIDNYLTAKEK